MTSITSKRKLYYDNYKKKNKTLHKILKMPGYQNEPRSILDSHGGKDDRQNKEIVQRIYNPVRKIILADMLVWSFNMVRLFLCSTVQISETFLQDENQPRCI